MLKKLNKRQQVYKPFEYFTKQNSENGKGNLWFALGFVDLSEEKGQDSERSLNIRFETYMREQNIDQKIENIPTINDHEISKEFKEVAIETSTGIRFDSEIINIQSAKHSDKDTSCNFYIQEEKTVPKAGVNAETDTVDMVQYQTPRHVKDFGTQEIDFRLTSSKEMDHKYRSIFSADKQDYR